MTRTGLVQVVVIVLCLPFLCSVLLAEEDSIELNWELGDYYFQGTAEGNVYLRIDNCFCTDAPGNPALPVRIYRIILPPDANLKSVKVAAEALETEVIKENCAIAPVPPYQIGEEGPFWGENEPYIMDGKNSKIYGSDQPYPANIVKVHDTGQMRKWKFVRVHFTPVRYRPKSGKITIIKKAKLKISYGRGTPYMLSAEMLNDYVFDKIAERAFDNFTQAKRWYLSQPAKDEQERGYAILTTAGVESNGCLADFIAHKESLGFTVHCVTDNHSSWLSSNYIEKHIIYAFIIANPSSIPAGGSDLGYQDFTGDKAPEVFAARFESGNTGDISKYLQKVIKYETATEHIEYRKEFLSSDNFGSSMSPLLADGCAKPGGFAVTAGTIRDSWEDDPFGVIFHRSHGMRSSIKTHFFKSDADKVLTAHPEKPGVVCIIACHCGEWGSEGNDSIAFYILKTCGIAVSANNGKMTGWCHGWVAPERGYAENLGYFYLMELMLRGNSVGASHCLGKFWTTDNDWPHTDYNEWNLKGDPSVRVQVGNKLRIISQQLHYAKGGRTYYESLSAVGGQKPYTWTLDGGELPPGIELYTDGSIRGKPTAEGGYRFRVRVTDATELAVAVKDLYIDTLLSGVKIVDNYLADAMGGEYYSHTFSYRGKNGYSGNTAYKWSWSGDTPPGLEWVQSWENENHGGCIFGVPTTPGTYSFKVSVDGKSKDFTLTVIDPSKLRIVTECLDNGKSDIAYSQKLEAAGGSTPYSWSIASGDLPSGLMLSGDTISGTPTASPGKFPFTVKVTAGSETATKELYIEILWHY